MGGTSVTTSVALHAVGAAGPSRADSDGGGPAVARPPSPGRSCQTAIAAAPAPPRRRQHQRPTPSLASSRRWAPGAARSRASSRPTTAGSAAAARPGRPGSTRRRRAAGGGRGDRAGQSLGAERGRGAASAIAEEAISTPSSRRRPPGDLRRRLEAPGDARGGGGGVGSRPAIALRSRACCCSLVARHAELRDELVDVGLRRRRRARARLELHRRHLARRPGARAWPCAAPRRGSVRAPWWAPPRARSSGLARAQAGGAGVGSAATGALARATGTVAARRRDGASLDDGRALRPTPSVTRFTSRARRASARRPAARFTGMRAASSSSASAGRPAPLLRLLAAASAGVCEPLASSSRASAARIEASASPVAPSRLRLHERDACPPRRRRRSCGSTSPPPGSACSAISRTR